MAFPKFPLRRLNEEGIRLFHLYLDSLAGDAPQEHPAGLLVDEETSTPIPAVHVEIEKRRFERRFDLARYLHERFEPHAEALREVERDKGLWAWLALLWFETLCPAGRGHRRQPGDRARWIPMLDKRRLYHRHLVLGPYLVYRAFAPEAERAMALLFDPPNRSRSTLVREITERTFATSPAVVEGVTRLYYAKEKGQMKRGAGGAAPGSVKRFVDLMSQLDRTYDLWAINCDQLLSLLPDEFSKYREE